MRHSKLLPRIENWAYKLIQKLFEVEKPILLYTFRVINVKRKRFVEQRTMSMSHISAEICTSQMILEDLDLNTTLVSLVTIPDRVGIVRIRSS